MNDEETPLTGKHTAAAPQTDRNHSMSTTPDPTTPGATTSDPATSGSPGPGAPKPSRRSAATPIVIVIAVLGGLVLLVGAGSAIVSSLFGFVGKDSVQTADVRGVSNLDIDSAAGSFTLRFEDVDEATLEVTQARGGTWTLERDGDELTVERSSGFGNWCLFGCSMRNETVVLTLPESLDSGDLDASVSLDAGEFTTEGAFRDIDLEISAGYVDIAGSARSLSADISAGFAELTVADAEEVDFDVSAGRIVAALSGDAPLTTSLDVSAGAVDLVLPDVTYDLRSQVSGGSLEHDLRLEMGARHTIDAEVSAGFVGIESR